MKLANMTLMGTLTLASLAHADIDALMPDWRDGFQKSDYITCQKALQPCRVDRDAVTANIACTQQVYTTQSACRQTQSLEAETGVLPTSGNIHSQAGVHWFNVHHLADGLDNYYMLDSSGRLLGLASSQNPLIANNPLYQTFMQPYPNGALQSMVAMGSYPTPQVRQQPDGSLQLIFSQNMKQQDCVACQTVGVAHVVYYFDRQGRYQAVQLASIEPVSVK